jgi:Ran GTPase-activating protein (RanGAP) involved in mRNA processing and transport
MKWIGDMLDKSNMLLEYLNLANCKFNNAGAGYVYYGVKRNAKMRHLILDRNDLSGNSLNELTSMLWSSNSLRKLSMENCNLKDDGIIFVTDGLEKNLRLQYINLKHNFISYVGAKHIANVIL